MWSPHGDGNEILPIGQEGEGLWRSWLYEAEDNCKAFCRVVGCDSEGYLGWD